ncbi:hypothetical protein J4407_03335 [Candidatus Pacearchaeota archaeon]|nr:hypothetical protein [Candidatus Pacearchaeota archaeon]
MAEKDTVYSSKIKYSGVFSFKDFYKFCYEWLTEETGLTITENKYSEKISGDSKSIEIKWSGTREMTDYFKIEADVSFMVMGLTKVEVNENGKKIETNKGTVQLGIKSSLVRDYNGKFETTAFNKFLRGVYEKWVIPSRINEFQGKISSDSDEFLAQAKAYLDLEGKR